MLIRFSTAPAPEPLSSACVSESKNNKKVNLSYTMSQKWRQVVYSFRMAFWDTPQSYIQYTLEVDFLPFFMPRFLLEIWDLPKPVMT